VHRTDILGYVYADEPAFMLTANQQFYYHLETCRLFDAGSIAALLAAESKSFGPHEVGKPSASYVASHEDMLEAPYPVLAAPTLDSTTPTSSQITVQWNNVTNNTGYLIQTGQTASGPWLDHSVNAANDVNVTFAGLDSSTDYYFRIFTMNENGKSDTALAVTESTT
jgi:hypothetical protein